MDFKTFLDHFETIAQAPNGIAKLRSLILDLAVRGKLVPQKPEDEPASTLLSKIQLDKEDLIRTKKIKADKALPKIQESTLDFEPALGWKWCYLVDISQKITDGEHATPRRSSSGYYLLSARNVKDGEIALDNVDYVPEDEFSRIRKRCDPDKGDILISCSGSVGRVAVVDKDNTYVMVRSAALVKLFQNYIYSQFLAYALRSRSIQNQIIEKSRASAQANLFLGKIKEIKIPLPPFAEQKRIVEKVDELMALCDRLQHSQETRDHLRQKLRESAIAALMNAETDEELQKSWAIVRDNLHTLSQNPEDVNDLRRSILQLAVEGKLTYQKTDDETGEALIEEINIAKQRIAKQVKVKRMKLATSIPTIERSLPIPENWGCTYLEGLIHPEYPISYGVLVPGADVENGVPFVRVQDLNLKNPPEKPNKSISKEIESSYTRTRLVGGEILMAVVGSIGKLGIAPTSWAGANIARAVCRILPISNISRDYLVLVLQSQAIQSYFLEATRTLAQPTLNISLVEKAQIPIPPLAEQKRIVAKVDELMQMCDQLEESLRQSQQTVEALAASAISHLTF